MVKLHQNPKLMALMSDRRGIEDVTLAKFRIGYDSTRKRFTIPVYAADGELLNVRLYDPYAKGNAPKMLPYATGYGTQLYNEKSLGRAR